LRGFRERFGGMGLFSVLSERNDNRYEGVLKL
jgi:hypothetical protein